MWNGKEEKSAYLKLFALLEQSERVWGERGDANGFGSVPTGPPLLFLF